MGNNNHVAAIYVRVSTLKSSQKDSPEHQRMLCEEKAVAEDLQVGYVYEDRDSGTSMIRRKEIQNLLDDANKGFFNTVIFSSLSRFSRDMMDALTMKRKLVEMYGVRVISIEEAFDSKIDTDELKFQLITAVNQKLSEQIALSSRRGIRQSARKGNFTGSIAPFGYKKIRTDDHRKSLAVIPENAEVVKTIFDLYVHNHMGEKSIVNNLNDREIPSPKGNLWQVTTIQRILQNEAYTGKNVFGKYTSKKIYNNEDNIHDHSKKLVQKNKEDWESNEEKNWEAIIPNEIFSKAQQIRLERGGGKRGGRRNVKNVLSGVVRCSHCGNSLVVTKSGKKGKDGQEYRYLVCSTRKRSGKHGCENGLWIPFEPFLNDILSYLSKQFQKVIDCEKIAAESNLKNNEKPQKIQNKKNQLNKKIQNLRKFLFELRKDFKLGEIDEEQYQFEKKELEKDLKNSQEQLALHERDKEIEDNSASIKKEMKEALDRLVNLDTQDKDELRFILKACIDEILVNKVGEVEVFTPFGTLH
ncbi:recombinase family protein [Peribacillus frigoritolerans]|uniref:recombinase family protein n=1 Tax=Peribacillus frigoritolerans TaxID=450367 RepID=UPI00105A84F0|nr:recombinase family protein [Peribacillus frigoritolerans]TDL82100.1 recombinase family protein [Peribacillus frigoritolerans]